MQNSLNFSHSNCNCRQSEIGQLAVALCSCWSSAEHWYTKSTNVYGCVSRVLADLRGANTQMRELILMSRRELTHRDPCAPACTIIHIALVSQWGPHRFYRKTISPKLPYRSLKLRSAAAIPSIPHQQLWKLKYVTDSVVKQVPRTFLYGRRSKLNKENTINSIPS